MDELARLVDSLVARRVRERRITLDKTQQWLAEWMGITPQQVHKYERGESRITAGRLSQIAEALDLAIDDFFTPQRSMVRRPEGQKPNGSEPE